MIHRAYVRKFHNIPKYGVQGAPKWGNLHPSSTGVGATGLGTLHISSSGCPPISFLTSLSSMSHPSTSIKPGEGITGTTPPPRPIAGWSEAQVGLVSEGAGAVLPGLIASLGDRVRRESSGPTPSWYYGELPTGVGGTTPPIDTVCSEPINPPSPQRYLNPHLGCSALCPHLF